MTSHCADAPIGEATDGRIRYA